MQGLVHVTDEVREHPDGLPPREGRRRAAQHANARARHLEDVGRPRAGERRVVGAGLKRDVRVVIGVLRRMREPEERRVPVLVERVLDRVGPDGGIRECFLRPQNLSDLGERPRALQVQFSHASDDAVPGVAERTERRAEGEDGGQCDDKVLHDGDLTADFWVAPALCLHLAQCSRGPQAPARSRAATSRRARAAGASSLSATLARVSDNFLVTCPYCGEEMEIFVEPDVHGTFVQDCEVCCNPWLVRVEAGEDDERHVSVGRADGSE